jgi:hypothetical protein
MPPGTATAPALQTLLLDVNLLKGLSDPRLIGRDRASIVLDLKE